MDRTPFTRAVCASPDDDTPRLVFADWLDEHDDPDRAAFIRLQCELATLTEDSPRRREVAYLARQLEDRNAANWAPPGVQVLEYRLARGFVEMVGLTAETLQDDETADLLTTNPIRRLWVMGMDGDVHPLRRRLPRANAVTALDLTGNDLTADSLRELAGISQFAGVRELGLLFNRLDDEAAQVLCGEAFFQRLTLIRCGANPMTDAGRQRLRDHFGDRVTFAAERDPGHRYTIRHADFHPGFCDGLTQAVMLDDDDCIRTVHFDHTGQGLRTEIRRRPTNLPTADARWDWRSMATDEWKGELGFKSSAVRVARFEFTDGERLIDFPPDWVEAFDYGDGPGCHAVRDELTRWITRGRFGYEFRAGDGSSVYWWLTGTGTLLGFDDDEDG